MAPRKRTKVRTLEPAVMKLHFVAATDSTNYISIAHSLSRLNRRFYRQGMNWAVANVQVLQQPGSTPAGGSTSYVNTIPHTWPVANAWVKAYHAWKDQQDDAIAEMGGESGVARYRDFKISMEDGHTVGNDLSPVSLGPGRIVGPFQTGIISSAAVNASEDWQSSEVVIPNDGAPGVTGQYNLHMVGPSVAGSKGIINGYEFSRAFPQSPDPVNPSMSTSWLNRLHNVGDNSPEIIDNAVDRNDELPYDQNEYPGGGTNFIQLETQGMNWNQSVTGINTYNTGPFTAPCGLIRVDFLHQTPVSGSTGVNLITVTLVPGKHRGYLAETMEEF